MEQAIACGNQAAAWYPPQSYDDKLKKVEDFLRKWKNEAKALCWCRDLEFATLLVRFENGAAIYYTHGNFDRYCMCFVDENGERHFPKDTEYFAALKELASLFGVKTVYEDFVKIYDETKNKINREMFNGINRLSQKYSGHEWDAERTLSILYVTMVSEELKAHTMLGKRIKRLGVHKVLIENVPIGEAANFMRRMSWKKIDTLCAERGF